jgi:hypothetical protein
MIQGRRTNPDADVIARSQFGYRHLLQFEVVGTANVAQDQGPH